MDRAAREARAAEIIRACRREGRSRGAMLDALCADGFSEYAADCVLDGHGLPPEEGAPPVGRASGLAAPASRAEPRGLGGWLWLPALSLLLSPVPLGEGLRDALETLGSPDLAQMETAYPGVSIVLRFLAASFVVLLALNVLAGVLFFTKHRLAPRFMVTFLAANALFTLGAWLLTTSVLPVPWDVGEVVHPFVAAAVWIPYFLTSRRVKNTFVNSWFLR